MTVCHNPDGEADYVMHKIEQLVRQKGYRYRDFAVLSGDVADYASAFKRKAAILNIPVFEDTKRKSPIIQELRQFAPSFILHRWNILMRVCSVI